MRRVTISRSTAFMLAFSQGTMVSCLVVTILFLLLNQMGRPLPWQYPAFSASMCIASYFAYSLTYDKAIRIGK